MTYKERYERDHANDKKPLSTRLIEIAVDTTIAISFISMVLLLACDFGDHPVPWFIGYLASIATFIASTSYRERCQDEEEEI